MAEPPRLAPPPGQQAGAVSPDDVSVQLQQMGLSSSDAQKPLANDLVWNPEPDDLDTELAMVEKELAQLNAMELSYSQSAEVHIGNDPVWGLQQSFDSFPEYSVRRPRSTRRVWETPSSQGFGITGFSFPHMTPLPLSACSLKESKRSIFLCP